MREMKKKLREALDPQAVILAEAVQTLATLCALLEEAGNRLTPQQAREAGYEIDTHCYPWFAYKGPRFAPTDGRQCWTEVEALALSLSGLRA